MNTQSENPLTAGKKYRIPTTALGGTVSQDGKALLVGCLDGIYEINLESGNYKKIDSHDNYVSSVCLAKNGQIISAGYDGKLQWFDLESQKRIRQITAHDFWSWQMAISANQECVATVTGQYIAGDYDYNPAAETEPSVKVFDADTGNELHQFSHIPSVQAVAISPDSNHLAAGNLMGEVRVYDLAINQQVAQWTTPDFTSWGIIKSHCNIGGIYDMQFSPDGDHVYVAGMGKMRDPMAGNGRQLWQKFSWKGKTPQKVDETHKGESGEGLMETLAIHPQGRHFIMAGRLRGGSWNAGLFDIESGKIIQSLKTGFRITQAVFNQSGEKLYLVGGQGQPKSKNGKFSSFGRIYLFDVNLS
ncbi:MAG: WD40 repeat domain-containing protein [Planctomycetota bacterium]|nr:WD40 repeat domain-containing protein [Planctomycetota bacterium]